MDRTNWNQIIGFTLIFAIIFLWARLNAPSEEELARQKAEREAIQQVEETPASPLAASPDTLSEVETEDQAAVDSIALDSRRSQYGIFAAASLGEEETYVLENQKMRLVFSNKGGYIKEALLKDYLKVHEDADTREDVKSPLYLLNDERNRFDYHLPLEGKTFLSSDFYHEAALSGNSITFTLRGDGNRLFQQTYTLQEDDFEVQYSVTQEGLDLRTQSLKLEWTNYLDRLEKNFRYERDFSTVYFKVDGGDPDYCSCRSSDEESLRKPIKWVSHANQFFNSTLIADQAFAQGEMRTIMAEDIEAQWLKTAYSMLEFPALESGRAFDMKLFIGPNDFTRLKAYGENVEDIIPFGWSLFGTVNRHIIRPIFTFLSSFIGSMGLVILVLTLMIKLVLYPLTYKMLKSQATMGALKPKLAHLKDKFKDDQQQIQIETMKMYREFGVNPLGGCLPMVLQMPIWIALYRFFPASIEFRQEGFLWANDLSSYDAFAQLPFYIPMYGDHVSLFTLIWVVTTIIYTYYNTKEMDMSMNPAMKYVQYFMPVMFLVFFNNFASGLTAYMCISNVINIGQTIVTKKYIIDHDKIIQKLEANKLKPKKKSSFQERLEAALREQQQKQQSRTTKPANPKKKK
jgi:YidC/Oxa1 family membrane protein insertase